MTQFYRSPANLPTETGRRTVLSLSANSLGHGYGPRITSADLSNRIRLPSRLPTLPSEAASTVGTGASQMRATSALHSQPQHFGYPRHTRISSGESAMSMDATVRSGRTFVARRKARGNGRDAKPIYHAITPGCRMALCSDEPGAGSDWAEPPGEGVICPMCLRRLARLGGPVRAVDERRR